jgi:hypothetical protein
MPETKQLILFRETGTKLISTYTAKHSYKIHLNSNFNNHVCIQPEHTCNLYVILDKNPEKVALHCKAFPFMLTRLSF